MRVETNIEDVDVLPPKILIHHYVPSRDEISERNDHAQFLGRFAPRGLLRVLASPKAASGP